MLVRDSRDEIWTRLVFDLVIWPNKVFFCMNSTLRSVVPLSMFVCSTVLSKVSSKWKTAVSNTISCFFNFASSLFSICPELMNSIFAISFTFLNQLENFRKTKFEDPYLSNLVRLKIGKSCLLCYKVPTLLLFFKWKGNLTPIHMEYGLPGPAHSSESPFSLSWIFKGVYLGRVLQNPPFHKLDLTRLYLYWSIILSLSSVSMKKEGAFICKRLYFCKTKIVPFYLFFLVLPLGMCTSSNHGGCQGSGRSPWGGHLIWTGEVL